MRNLKFIFTLSAGLAALCAQAQMLPGSERMDYLHRGAFMLIDARVQKRVGLSEDQVAKVTRLIEDHSQKQTAFIQLSPPNVEGMNKEEDQASAAILKVLSSDQTTKLKHAALRAAGYGALTTPEVASELKLSTDQQKKVAKVLDDASLPMEKLQEIIGRRINKEPKKSGEILKEYSSEIARLLKQQKADEAKALAILSPAQQTAWKSMTD